MNIPKAFAMNRRAPSTERARRPALLPEDAASIRCRHCGGSQLKLSYRRYDKSAHAEDDAQQTTFILRCAACEGFTTISA